MQHNYPAEAHIILVFYDEIKPNFRISQDLNVFRNGLWYGYSEGEVIYGISENDLTLFRPCCLT